MRTASSYRAAKKKAAREAGVPFAKFNEHYQKSRMFAAHELERKALAMTPEGARQALGIWAANGGRASVLHQPADLKAMNGAAAVLVAPKVEGDVTPEQKEVAVDKAAKLTAADIDKALESALSTWQAAQKQEPLPLSRVFAVRARMLGWVENVEFVEEA